MNFFENPKEQNQSLFVNSEKLEPMKNTNLDKDDLRKKITFVTGLGFIVFINLFFLTILFIVHIDKALLTLILLANILTAILSCILCFMFFLFDYLSKLKTFISAFFVGILIGSIFFSLISFSMCFVG